MRVMQIGEERSGTVEVMNDFKILSNGSQHRLEELNKGTDA